MKINDEGTSNAAYWHERAMKAEARLAEAERLLHRASGYLGPHDHRPGNLIDEVMAFLEGTTVSASEVQK